MRYLSKTDFKLGLSCPRKIYYQENHYPKNDEGNEFMELLSEGGIIIGKLAQLQYPDGILIESLRIEEALARTAEELKKDKVILFEAALSHGRLISRHDILIKDGNHFQLIEVKSKGLDLSDPDKDPILTQKGEVRAPVREILEDITFQKLVLSRAFPESIIDCYLMAPVKREVSTVDGFLSPFSLYTTDQGALQAKFSGKPEDVKDCPLISRINVNKAVDILHPDVEKSADTLAEFYDGDDVLKPDFQIGHHCKNCEFLIDQESDGFSECWGDLAKPSPHIFDLFNLYHAGKGQGLLANYLIQQGKTSLFDIDCEQDLCGAHANRQKIQIQHQKSGKEYVSGDLKRKMSSLEQPLYFIDFETCGPAIPYYQGMETFEDHAFQWSCHTLDGGILAHSEWLQKENAYPNLEFAETLLEAVGNKGTILIWTGNETGILKKTAAVIRERYPEKSGLADRIDALIPRLVDQCEMTREHYFHPAMAGSNSLKSVLPAVWSACGSMRDHDWFKDYCRMEGDCPVNPYKTLPASVKTSSGEEIVVREGTGAIRAYHEMLCGPEADRETWRQLLLQYCKLDTLAMVIVWKYWESLVK